MSEETCKWHREEKEVLIWHTSCDHQIGTPIEWEPIEGMACMCCQKPVEIADAKICEPAE